MAGTIGIKIANGDFYPIIEENSPVKKRLVLTTVHDRQSNVQIDLFRSISKSMLDAQYIGRLTVEKIRSRSKGDPSIEMVISVDRDGNIRAEAYDLDASNGERHTLNVSLQEMDSLDQADSMPDFDFGNDPHRYERAKSDERKFPWLILGLSTLFIALVIAMLWFFFLGGRDVFSTAGTEPDYGYTAPQPPARQETQPIQEPAPLPPLPTFEPEPAVIKAPASPPPARQQTARRVRPPAPVMSFRVPAVIPKNGVVYQIKWGDTLWDISAAFYRNPWLYPRIAKDNKIKNPDFIIAGSNVRIYPKN
jgi:hypothetical protein